MGGMGRLTADGQDRVWAYKPWLSLTTGWTSLCIMSLDCVSGESVSGASRLPARAEDTRRKDSTVALDPARLRLPLALLYVATAGCDIGDGC